MRPPAQRVSTGLLPTAVAAALAAGPLGLEAQETPADTLPADTLSGPAAVRCVGGDAAEPGAPGVAWADTAAARRLLSEELGVQRLADAGASRLVERGDEAFRRGHHTVAYTAYAAAVRADGGYDALWRAARAAVDVGQDVEGEPQEWYGRGEALARRAIEIEPGRPEGHLHLATALGLVALDAGVRERVRLSEEIRKEARATLEADSSNAGGWHVLGRWHKGVRELSGPARFFARTFLGGEVLGQATWENAERFLRRAAELEPDRVVHPLELGKVYLQTDRPAAARRELERALELPARDRHDCVYQAEARDLLQEISG